MKKNLNQLVERTKNLIEAGNIENLNKFLDDLNISTIEDLIDEIPEYAAVIIDSLSLKRAVNAFRILDVPTQERIIKKLPEDKVSKIINGLPPDDLTSFLGELKDEKLVVNLISYLSSDDKKRVSLSFSLS
ncbi:MAG: magnesium transporter MgtE N-terminal domain-containing protein [Dysgonomonas sp.]